MGSFALYLLGAVIAIGGAVYGAHLAGAPLRWIVVGAVILFGLAMIGATRRLRGGGRSRPQE